MTNLTYSLQPLLPLKPPHHRRLTFRSPSFDPSTHVFKRWRRRTKVGRCRAELVHDAPFVAAIGACVVGSLVLPEPAGDGEEGGSAMDSTDARFAVMAVISCIPYFNWLSWVFAWLDTGKRRYLVNAIVYFAPYLRTGFSLSPDESWLPITSIIFCIVHVQLQTSIKNGDIKTLDLFGSALKLLPPAIRKKKLTNVTFNKSIVKIYGSIKPAEPPSAKNPENEIIEGKDKHKDKQHTNVEDTGDETDRNELSSTMGIEVLVFFIFPTDMGGLKETKCS